jgi:hypothetical protein
MRGIDESRMRQLGRCDADDCSVSFIGRIISLPAVNSSLDSIRLEGQIRFIQAAPKDPQDLVSYRRAMTAADAFLDSQLVLRALRTSDNSFSTFPEFEGCGRALALYRIVRCAIALFQHASFPTKLPDLGKDSIDPFTNQPLLYGSDRKHFLLYSVGSDTLDDQGESDDIAFRYPYAPKPKPERDPYVGD